MTAGRAAYYRDHHDNMTPSSLDLLLSIVRFFYEHGTLRAEGDRAADVGKEP